MRSKKTYLGNFNSIEMGVVLNSASNGNLFTLPTNSLGKY